MRGIRTASLLATLVAAVVPALAEDVGTGSAGPTARIDLAKQAWHGRALSYSGYRASQSPTSQTYPTQAQVTEDLRILARNWRLLRVYSTDRHGQDVLEVIRREKLPLQVMIGAWIDGRPDHVENNAAQVRTAVRLANEYKDVVAAINVGDEALAAWSAHKTTEDALLGHVRTAKAGVSCPVTVAEDWAYWAQPSARLVDAVDFIGLHSYPVWNKHDIDTALAATVASFEAVRKAHPAKTIAITQAGWPSLTVGAPFVPGAGDETKQKRYYDELSAWAQANGVTVFVFEAFDEPWKGAGTERHWGLFTEARRAKPVVQALFPDLAPAGPPADPGKPDPPAR